MHRIHAIGRVSPAFKSNEILIVGYTITVIFGPKSLKFVELKVYPVITLKSGS